MFKQFLTESPTSLDFLSTIANENGKKLSYPDSSKELILTNSAFPEGYNMIMERINGYLIALQKNPNLENEEGFPKKHELELLKTVFPISVMVATTLKQLEPHFKKPFPIWDIVGNKIFLLDIKGNSYSAYSKDIGLPNAFAICDAYKNFILHAFSHPEYSAEDDPSFAKQIQQATII